MGKIDFDKFILSLHKFHDTTPKSWEFALSEQGWEIVDGQIVRKEAKFKVGDVVIDKQTGDVFTIAEIDEEYYTFDNGGCEYINAQNDYELYKEPSRITSAKAKEAILPDKEDELTEFESKLKYYLNNDIPDMYQYSDDVIKCHAVELLSIARKQIAEEIRNHARKMYRDFDDSYYSTKNGAYLRGIKDTIKKIEGE